MRLRNIPAAKEIVPASPYTIQAKEGQLLDIEEIFKDSSTSLNPQGLKRPLHIEVGMGKGAFLIGMAELHPGINYIGIERYESVMLRALQALDKLENPPENLRLICMDAEKLPEIFGKESVDRIYLNFSDPWPKTRHEKRRLTSEHFLKIYEKIIKPGSLLEFKTDNRELFDFSLGSIENAPEWTIISKTYDLHRELGPEDENVMTEYEEKFSKLGSRICKLTARFR